MNDKIRELNDEIEDLERDILARRLAYEEEKAKLWVSCDFPSAIGVAKPTVAQKESYVKLETIDLKEKLGELEIILGSKKRLFSIMLKEIGDVL